MADLYRETERWIECVKTCADMYSIMWDCLWDKICKSDIEVMGHVDSYSLADVLNPRDALYGGRCERFALPDQSTDLSVITDGDLQSLYPYVCKRKQYPVGHPRCLIGPNHRDLDVNSYEGLIKCKILPSKGLRILLLPCHINGKLMFVLCRACAETINCGICGHTRSERCLTGTWALSSCRKQWPSGTSLYKSTKRRTMMRRRCTIRSLAKEVFSHSTRTLS